MEQRSTMSLKLINTIIDYTYWLLPNVKLRIFLIVSVLCLIATMISIIVMISNKMTLNKHKSNNVQNNNVEIITIVKTNDLEQKINSWFLISIILFIITTCICGIFISYDAKAKIYGAYDNVHYAQTLSQIKNSIDNGFIESYDIPTDPKGHILIFFKYGCPDCSQIHDDLKAYIKDNKLSDYYFISSRSKIGKSILNDYPIDEVPCMVYIKKDSSTIKYLAEVIYAKQSDTSNLSVFTPEKADIIIQEQIKECKDNK